MEISTSRDEPEVIGVIAARYLFSDLAGGSVRGVELIIDNSPTVVEVVEDGDRWLAIARIDDLGVVIHATQVELGSLELVRIQPA